MVAPIVVAAIAGATALATGLGIGTYWEVQRDKMEAKWDKITDHANAQINKANVHLQKGEYRLAYHTYKELKRFMIDNDISPEYKAKMENQLEKLKNNYISEGRKDGTVILAPGYAQSYYDTKTGHVI